MSDDRERRRAALLEPGGASVDPSRFFASIARERRLRRAFHASLDDGSTLLALSLPASPRPVQVEPLPGEAAPPAASVQELPEAAPLDRQIGLNSIKSWTLAWHSSGEPAQPAMFGNLGSEPITDSARLGAQVLRQVGDRDLVWTALAPDPSSRAAFGQGQPLRLSSDAQVLADRNIDNVAELLSAAHDRNVKLVLTYLHLGAGGTEFQADETFDYGPDGTFPADVDAWGDLDMDGVQDLELHRGPHCALPWASEHQGRSVALEEGGTAEFVDRPATDPLVELHYAALEPGMTYKGQVVADVADRVVELLDRAAEGAGVILDQVVWAIEIFNEIDVRSVYFDGPDPDPGHTGRQWGAMCCRVARALRRSLDARGWSDVKLMLPALSSFDDAEDGEAWTDKLTFAAALVQGFIEQAASMERVVRGMDLWQEFGYLVQAWDVHWYHRDAEGRRSVLYWGPQLVELREAVETGAFQGGVDPQDAKTLATALTFTNFESSVSIEGYGSTTSPSQDWHPAGLLGLQAWQASEVWRRLCGALAGGVKVAGWHAWMSGRAGPFVGCGLRDEGGLGDGDDAIFERDAGDSTQRLSWFAFQRLGDLVAPHPFDLARVAWPVLDSRSAVDAYVSQARAALLDPGSANWREAAPALVFEFRNPRLRYPWTYVLMLDWTLFPNESLALAFVQLRHVQLVAQSSLSSRPSVSAYEYDAIPDLPREGAAVTYSTGGLPLLDSPFYAGVEVSDASALLYPLNELRHPLVLKTRRRLGSWSVQPTGLVASSVPAWMDDGREPVPG